MMRALLFLTVVAWLNLVGCSPTGGGGGEGGGEPDGLVTTATTNFDAAPIGEDPITIEGVTFAGGIVGTLGVTRFYSSGLFSFEVAGGDTATITFDPPAAGVRMFLVHREGASGTVTAIGADGELDSINSQAATTFGAADRFVEIIPDEPIETLEVEAGGDEGTFNVFIDDLEVFAEADT